MKLSKERLYVVFPLKGKFQQIFYFRGVELSGKAFNFQESLAYEIEPNKGQSYKHSMTTNYSFGAVIKENSVSGTAQAWSSSVEGDEGLYLPKW